MNFNINLVLNGHQLKEIMAAIDSLNSAITDLTTAVNNIPQAGTPPTGGATEIQVQAAADQVNAQTAIINTKLTPTP